MKLKIGDKRKPKSWYTIVSETYKDFAENTSIHGLKYTVRSEIGNWEKFFWYLVIVSGLCGAAYMTVLFWERYLSNPTRTTILTEYAPSTSIPFPAVTICNINRIFESKLDHFVATLNITSNDKQMVKKAIPQLLSFNYQAGSIPYNMTELHFLQTTLEKNKLTNISSVMRQLSQRCDEMLIYCSWNSKTFECTDRFKESLTVDGYCCSFNYLSKKDIYTPFSGKNKGLAIMLNPMLQNVQYSSLFSSGFKVIIHDPTEYPGSLSTTRIVAVKKVAHLQVIGIKMSCSEEVRSLPVNQRNCFYPHEHKLEQFNNMYSSSNCLTQCDANKFYKVCGCVPYYYPFLAKPVCNISHIPCLNEVKSVVQPVTRSGNDCDCIAQCEDDIYNILSTSATYEYGSNFSVHEIINLTAKDYSFLRVFFVDQTNAVYLRDTITSTLYLLSSFGGVYSLFIGCSLITIIEIVYYSVFRFLVNLKLLGKVNGSVEETTKRKKSKQSETFYGPFYINDFYHGYNHNVFLP